jgi:hypothetical protein
VADFEPQYNRLNQIMKWSAILGSYAENLPAPLLSLSSVSVPSAGRFDSWWARHRELKVTWDLKFLSIVGESTECMTLIQSEPFRMFGGLYVMSGGVSTYTDEQIAERKVAEPARASITDSRLRAVGLDAVQADTAGTRKKIVSADKTTFSREPNGVWSTTVAKDARLDGHGSSIAGETIISSFKPTTNGLTIDSRIGSAPLASLSIDRTESGFRLKGNEGPAFAAARHLTSLSGGVREDGILRSSWTLLDLGEGQFLMQSSADTNWAIASPVTDPASAPRGVRAAIGPRIVDVQSLRGTEVEKRIEGRDWLAIFDSSLERGDLRVAVVE